MTTQQIKAIDGHLGKFKSLSREWPELILGGSLALILQKTIPYRTVCDIDVVGHRYYEFEGATINHFGGSDDDTNCIVIEIAGVKYDFFLAPYVVYKTVEFEGIKVKVQDARQIISAKYHYFSKHNIEKHRDDVLAYMEIQKNGFKELTQEEELLAETEEELDLPF